MEAKQSTQRRSLTNNTEVPAARQAGRPLTKRELAGFLGISERFIELEVNRGRLRAVRFSNRLLRFRPIDVERWMESSLTTAGEARRGEHHEPAWVQLNIHAMNLEGDAWVHLIFYELVVEERTLAAVGRGLPGMARRPSQPNSGIPNDSGLHFHSSNPCEVLRSVPVRNKHQPSSFIPRWQRVYRRFIGSERKTLLEAIF